jgi:hypothetical protein
LEFGDHLQNRKERIEIFLYSRIVRALERKKFGKTGI